LVQCASEAYRDALKTLGAVASMSRKGDCWDSEYMAESFFGLHQDDQHGADAFDVPSFRRKRWQASFPRASATVPPVKASL